MKSYFFSSCPPYWCKLSITKVLLFLLTLIALPAALSAQATLRGTIRDADNSQPLVGATVRLDTQNGTTSDSLGRFRFEGVLPGRYTLSVSYLGYQQLELKEVLVANGKEKVLEVLLLEAPTSLTAVTVKGTRSLTTSSSPNLRRLTQEETLRFPATFLDPGRLATAYPGVNGADDQANHLVIRGQAPNGMHWRLEGLEIVNPNHTANAGTFNDRTTLNGGGVNAISAQLLTETEFHLGAFPANYGNATAGLLDMKLRDGNNEKGEYTFQAGLIGIDVAAEGPLGKHGSSYLVNYRYSATGLLSDLGVPLGDEDIRFQDLSFNLTFPGKNNDRLKIFGLFGLSRNAFVRPEDSTAWDTEKYLYENIDFEGRLGVAGFHYTRPRSDKGQWLLAGAWSSSSNDRTASSEALMLQERDVLDQTKLNVRAAHRWKLLPFGSLDLGIEALWLEQVAAAELRGENENLSEYTTEGLTLSPYLSWRYQIKKVAAQFGYRASWYTNWLDEGIYSEPRLMLSYLFNKKSTLGVDFSKATQAPSPYSPARLPRSTRQWSLFWSQLMGEELQLQIQLYDQHLDQVAGSGARNDLNQIAVFTPATDGNGNLSTTEGRNRGLELSLQRFATGDWWYLVSGSLFQAEYLDEAGEWVPSRFATDYAAAVTLGKEWSGIDRQERATRLGANIGLRLNGGQRALPIDIAASEAQQRTVFAYDKGFTEELPDYLRVDLRVYYQKNHPGWNSTLSLDIQNVTGQENTAYFYYDRLLGAVTERFQLEFIPIISYRINF